MEKWEHVVLQVLVNPGGPELQLQPPQEGLTTELQSRGAADVMAVLNELGAAGWQLVAVEESRSYWLKRQAPPPRSKPAQVRRVR